MKYHLMTSVSLLALVAGTSGAGAAPAIFSYTGGFQT